MVRSFIYCMRSLSSKNVCTYLILNRLNTTSAMLMLASARISTRASWIIVWWWQRRRRRRRRAFSGCERCWIEFAFRVRHTNIMYLCVCWLSALALNKYCASKSTAAAIRHCLRFDATFVILHGSVSLVSWGFSFWRENTRMTMTRVR